MCDECPKEKIAEFNGEHVGKSLLVGAEQLSSDRGSG